MEFSIWYVVGQLIGLLILAIVFYFIALIPISLRRIAAELAEIKDELKKRNGPRQ